MTNKDKERLEELETRYKLVYKGTGEVIGKSYPGGAPITDDDRYEWTGTEEERSEYNRLYWEGVKERAARATESFQRALVGAFYGGKMTK